MQWISYFILCLAICILGGVLIILPGLWCAVDANLIAATLVKDVLTPVSLCAWIFPSLYISFSIASYLVEQEKDENLLRLFGLNCSNCKYLKKAFFRGLKCNLKNTSTIVTKTCSQHSEYASFKERHQSTKNKISRT